MKKFGKINRKFLIINLCQRKRLFLSNEKKKTEEWKKNFMKMCLVIYNTIYEREKEIYQAMNDCRSSCLYQLEVYRMIWCLWNCAVNLCRWWTS